MEKVTVLTHQKHATAVDIVLNHQTKRNIIGISLHASTGTASNGQGFGTTRRQTNQCTCPTGQVCFNGNCITA